MQALLIGFEQTSITSPLQHARGQRSDQVKQLPPGKQEIRPQGEAATVSPKLDIVRASAESNRERFVHAIENYGIGPFLNISGVGNTPI
jgi:hypothetical protein